MTTDNTTEQQQEELERKEQQQQPEKKPAAPAPAAEQQPNDESHEPGTSQHTYALRLPELPTNELPDGYEDHLNSFGAAAAAAGIESRTAQRLVNAFVDASLDQRANIDLNSEFARDDAETFLQQHWREDYDRQMA